MNLFLDRVGQALSAGDIGKELAYMVAGNFPEQEGSVSVWIKPVDWK